MSLRFSFNGSSSASHDHAEHADQPPTGGIPLPFAGASSRAPLSSSSTLELRVSLQSGALVCEGLSGDGVSYAKAQKALADEDPAALAAALRSVLARTGAELPEPLLGSVTGVMLQLSGSEVEALKALGLSVSPGSAQLAAVDAALQARTGIAAGTPIALG